MWQDYLIKVLQEGFKGTEEPQWLKQIKPEPIDKEKIKKAALVSGIASLVSGLAGAALAKGAGVGGVYPMAAGLQAASMPLQVMAKTLAEREAERRQAEQLYRRGQMELGLRKEAERGALMRTMIPPLYRMAEQETELERREKERKAEIEGTKEFLRTVGLPENIAPAVVDNPRLVTLISNMYAKGAPDLRDIKNLSRLSIQSYNKRWANVPNWYEEKKEGGILGIGGKKRYVPTDVLLEAINEFEGLRQLAQASGYDLKLSVEPAVVSGKTFHRLQARIVPPGMGGYDTTITDMLQQLQPAAPTLTTPTPPPTETTFAPLSTDVTSQARGAISYRFPEAQWGSQIIEKKTGKIITAPSETVATVAGQLKQMIDTGQITPADAYDAALRSEFLKPEEKEYIKKFIVENYYVK